MLRPGSKFKDTKEGNQREKGKVTQIRDVKMGMLAGNFFLIHTRSGRCFSLDSGL